jgi:hypothetical protein
MERAITENLQVYPSYGSVVWPIGKSHRGKKLSEIPQYYFEWYIQNGNDYELAELSIAWMTSIESHRVYAQMEYLEGIEELTNGRKQKEIQEEVM